MKKLFILALFTLSFFIFPSVVNGLGVISDIVQEGFSIQGLESTFGIDPDLLPPATWRKTLSDLYTETAISPATKPYVLFYTRNGFGVWFVAFCDEAVRLEKTSTTTPGVFRFKTVGGSNKTSGCDFWNYLQSSGQNYPSFPMVLNHLSHSTSYYFVDEGPIVLANGGVGCYTYTRFPLVLQQNYELLAINNFITEGSGNADISSYCSIYNPNFSGFVGASIELPVDELEVIDKSAVQSSIADALTGTAFEFLIEPINIVVGFVIDFINWVANFLYSIIDWIINELILPEDGFMTEQFHLLQDAVNEHFPGIDNIFQPLTALLDEDPELPDPISFEIFDVDLPVLDFSVFETLIVSLRPFLVAGLWFSFLLFCYSMINRIFTGANHDI